MQSSKSSNKNNNLYPPVLKISPIRHGRIRYDCTADTSVAFGTTDLFNAVGIVATTSILANPIAVMARLTKVSMWCAYNSSTATALLSLRWVTSSGSADGVGQLRPNVYLEDETNSSDRPASISSKPPKGGFSAAWHYPNNSYADARLFFMTLTDNAILDIEYEFILNGEANITIDPTTTTQAVVGATAGRIYHRPVGGSGTITPRTTYNVI